MRSIAVAFIALLMAACQQAKPAEKFVGEWEANGKMFSIVKNGDSYLLQNHDPNAMWVLTGIGALPLTPTGDQLASNTILGNMSVSGDTLYFGGGTFHRYSAE